MWEDIALELARIERAALDAVRKRMSEQQLGEAWEGLAEVNADDKSFRGSKP